MQDLPPLWSHQSLGIAGFQEAVARGERRVCLTSPTGGGKSRILAEIIREYLSKWKKVILYTNRRLLLDQLSGVLGAFGLDHGIRAAGVATNAGELLQVSSIQTESSRVYKSKLWDLHEAELVILDEAHQQCGPQARRLIDAHYESGASILGVTATPLDLEGIYDSLVVAGTTSELRACGALVPCHHFGPDEPDIRKIKKPLGEDLSEKEIRQAIMTKGIFGRVYDWFNRLNQEHKPTILFAPGVKESVYFAEQFYANGVSAAHIDGQEVWVNGSFIKGRTARRDILEGSRMGDIKVLCNRFVLREGIDAPWLSHGILATIFGSLGSYLQSGGRLLRSHPSLQSVALQDHGGNWWRHGSLNADRAWRLGDTSRIVAGLREDALRQKREKEPNRCPQCGEIIGGGVPICPCGFLFPGRAKSRPVIQSNGELKEMSGDIYRPRRICTRPDGPRIWEKMYYRSKSGKGKRAFRAAFALFAYENNWAYPDPDWPLMPIDVLDSFKQVEDVPMERLKR